MMPTYDAQCCECDAQFSYVASIADCLNVPNCELCNGVAKKMIFSAPKGFVKGKFEAYKSIVDGTIISTASDLAEHNRRNGVVNLNDGWSEEAIRSGNIGEKKVENHKEDIAGDMAESIHKLNQGYRPTVGADDDNF